MHKGGTQTSTTYPNQPPLGPINQTIAKRPDGNLPGNMRINIIVQSSKCIADQHLAERCTHIVAHDATQETIILPQFVKGERNPDSGFITDAELSVEHIVWPEIVGTSIDVLKK